MSTRKEGEKERPKYKKCPKVTQDKQSSFKTIRKKTLLLAAQNYITSLSVPFLSVS